jgi:hypothetical protein
VADRSGLESPRLTVAVLTGFALVFAGLSIHGYRQHSSTFDEPLHLAAGYAAVAHGDHRVDPTHPPLIRMWAALPLVFTDRTALDLSAIDSAAPAAWLQQSYGFSHRFLYVDNDADRLLYGARFMVVALGVLLGTVLFLWARAWLGLVPAVAALVLYTVEPNLAAHATLVTTDLGVTCFLFTSVYFLWRVCRTPTTANALGFAAFGALATVAKFSGMMVAPLALCLLAGAVLASRVTIRRAGGLLALLAAAMVLSVWAVYGFRYAPGPTESWLFAQPEPAPAHDLFSGAARLAAWVDDHRLLPNAFTQGFVVSQASARMLPAFLAGEYSVDGWWYYFPLAFLVKTPIALLTMVAVGLFAWVKRRDRFGRLEVTLVAVPIIVFAGFAVASQINLGLRHILPVYPFLLLVAAAGVKEVLGWRPRAGLVAVAAVAIFGVMEFAAVYPHPLTFFNQLAGGPQGGRAYLVDSNLDWGQHLKLLKRWMEENGVPHVNLAYFGSADPAYYGIDCTHLPGAPVFAEQAIARPRLPGYVAVSATVLSGVYLPRRWRLHYQPLRKLTPVAELGNSILVYWLEHWPDLTGLPDRATASSQEIDVLHRLADSVFTQQWDTRAAVYYRRYLEYRPDDASALGNLGVALMSTGRQDRALEAFGRAVRLAPADARLQRNYAMALLEIGQVDEAVAHAERAVELRPQDPAARALLRQAMVERSRR